MDQWKMDQWKMDAESEDHRARRDMTEKSIARYVKGETERQVTSSATSSAVFVSDSTYIMGATAAQPSYLCCGLSNGSVCLLNTANLSKIYLFEMDRDPRAAQRDSGRPVLPPPQLVAVATHPVAPGGLTSSAQLLLCVTLDGEVCICPMDMSTVLERKKVSRSDMAKVKAYPALNAAAEEAVTQASVQFNARGNRVAAVLATRGAAASASACYRVAVLSTSDTAVTLQSSFQCPGDWHTLVPPAAHGGPCAAAAAVELCYCGWWSADLLLCVWSNSCLQLLRAADMAVVAERRVLRHCGPDAVTCATVSRHSATADEAEEAAVTNIVALALEHNTAATFYVTSRGSGGGGGSPELKRARAEAALSLSVSPTLQTYCTEEIPIREVYLLRSFSWTALLLLESGALIFLDVETMRLSVHRAVNRLRAPDADRYYCRAPLTLPRHFFCVVQGKPFGVTVVEHNAAILLKAQ